MPIATWIILLLYDSPCFFSKLYTTYSYSPQKYILHLSMSLCESEWQLPFVCIMLLYYN